MHVNLFRWLVIFLSTCFLPILCLDTHSALKHTFTAISESRSFVLILIKILWPLSNHSSFLHDLWPLSVICLSPSSCFSMIRDPSRITHLFSMRARSSCSLFALNLQGCLCIRTLSRVNPNQGHTMAMATQGEFLSAKSTLPSKRRRVVCSGKMKAKANAMCPD